MNLKLTLNSRSKIRCFFKIKNAFLVFLLLYFIDYSQAKDNFYGVPYIQNFSPTEYGSERQNLCMVQDNRGVNYFGNQNGILVYDKLSWENIYLPGLPRMDLAPSGRIYVGGFNEFGYLTGESTKVHYQSLNNQFLKKEEFGLVINVTTVGENVLFETSEKLYFFHHEYVQVIDAKIVSRVVFKANNRVFINHSTKGLCVFEDNRVVSLPGGLAFVEKEISDVFYWQGKYFVRVADEPDFYTIKGNSFEKITLSIEHYFSEHQYSQAIVLPSGQLAIATRGNGIFILNEQEDVLLHLTKQTGLQDEFVNYLYVDQFGNIWACLRNGISRIEYPSSTSFFNMKNNFEGGVFSMIRHGRQLVVGTDNGVFVREDNPFPSLDAEKQSSFLKLPESTGFAYQFFLLKKELFLSASKGIFRINGNEISRVYAKPSRVSLPVAGDLIVSGWDGSVEILRFNGTEFISEASEKINGRVQNIVQAGNGEVWLSTSYYGLYKLKITSDYPMRWNFEALSNSYQIPSGHGLIQLEKSKDEIYFLSELGLLRYNPQEKNFRIDEKFYYRLGTRKQDIQMLKCDNAGNFYLFINKPGGKDFTVYKTTQMRDSSFTPYQHISIKDVSDFAIESVYSDEEGIIWFCGAEGLIRYDEKFKPAVKEVPLIFNAIYLEDDSTIYVSTDYQFKNHKKDFFTIDYWNNFFRISFVCPAFSAGSDQIYSYLLEKYDHDWSEWSEKTEKEYTNINPGKYVFKVKVKDVIKNEIQEKSIGVWIKPPWYLTKIAYSSYLILFIAFIWMWIKIRSYQYAKEKIELERQIKEKTDDLVKEIERSEDLLLNMLPKEISKELRLRGKAMTSKFELVSVMFMDIQGFTDISERVDPDFLVKSLDKFFLAVDRIVSKYNIEKIKTIGDGYMCAGGIPVKNRTNPIEVVLAALEVQQFIHEIDMDYKSFEGIPWGLRIGIHTGPVIAGVIGDKRLSYDIWGVTVNSASRMESNGVAGEVMLSQVTNDLIKSYFETEYHGSLTLRSGKITDMYKVKGLKTAFRNGPSPFNYNQLLRFEMAELRYLDLYEWAITKLEKELDQNLLYHNVLHTVDVVSAARRLCREEQLDAESDLLVRTAALLHDIGFTVDYDNHEFHSVKIAKETLPGYHYNLAQIEKVCELIMATRYPPNPTNHLEEIICDADLDYLGRRDFVNGSKNLFMELYQRKKIKSVDEWIKAQISFIETHTYFTKSAIRSREVNKIQQLENLRKMDFLSGFF